jgi:hypothetical protein
VAYRVDFVHGFDLMRSIKSKLRCRAINVVTETQLHEQVSTHRHNTRVMASDTHRTPAGLTS